MPPRRRRGGHGGRGRGGSMFIGGGWLCDWKPSGNYKKRFRKQPDTIPVPNSKQLVLAAQHGCAAVFEDKQPMQSPRFNPEDDEDRDRDPEEVEDFRGFSCSSIESAIAEDYAENLSDEEELTSTMVFEDFSSSNEDEEEELEDVFPEDSDESDGSEDRNIFVSRFMDGGSDCSSEELDELDLQPGSARQAVPWELRTVVEPSFVMREKPSSKKKTKKPSYNKPKATPGEKKHLRKEKIADKRRQRASSRGIDLDRLNQMFEGMVVTNSDMISLQPMKQKDFSLVSKLAAVYRLKMTSQGSGRKRFPVVFRTSRTCLPQGAETDQLLKILGNIKPLTTKDATKLTPRRAEKSPRDKRAKGSSIKKEPVNFVSSGVVQPEEQACEVEVVSARTVGSSARSFDIGRFEAHTKGFGSRMMAKMGFVEGGGLGKDGQGMKQALLPQMRPKCLGLGAARGD